MGVGYSNIARLEALAMTYGYFLGGGTDNDDKTQIAMCYRHDKLTKHEAQEVLELIKYSEEQRNIILPV